MKQAVWTNLQVQAHLAAASASPETMSVDDFMALYAQKKIIMYHQRDVETASVNSLLRHVGHGDAARYLCEKFAVARDKVDSAEYSVYITGDPLRKIHIVYDPN